jgi:hypothetical protein
MKIETYQVFHGRWENEDYFIHGERQTRHSSIRFVLVLKDSGNRFIFDAFLNDLSSYKNNKEDSPVLNVLEEGRGYTQIIVPKIVYEAIGDIIIAVSGQEEKIN